MLKLFSRYDVPAVCAVIPKDFLRLGRKSASLIKKHAVYVALHGIEHVDNSSSAQPKNEFPEGTDTENTVGTITKYYQDFADVFGTRLIPVFVPPFNASNRALDDSLLSAGFVAVSKANQPGAPRHSHHVDIDFINANR